MPVPLKVRTELLPTVRVFAPLFTPVVTWLKAAGEEPAETFTHTAEGVGQV
jgi:hypothetical protein